MNSYVHVNIKVMECGVATVTAILHFYSNRWDLYYAFLFTADWLFACGYIFKHTSLALLFIHIVTPLFALSRTRTCLLNKAAEHLLFNAEVPVLILALINTCINICSWQNAWENLFSWFLNQPITIRQTINKVKTVIEVHCGFFNQSWFLNLELTLAEVHLSFHYIKSQRGINKSTYCLLALVP